MRGPPIAMMDLLSSVERSCASGVGSFKRSTLEDSWEGLGI